MDDQEEDTCHVSSGRIKKQIVDQDHMLILHKYCQAYVCSVDKATRYSKSRFVNLTYRVCVDSL